jgi:hypothetical protein
MVAASPIAIFEQGKVPAACGGVSCNEKIVSQGKLVEGADLWTVGGHVFSKRNYFAFFDVS